MKRRLVVALALAVVFVIGVPSLAFAHTSTKLSVTLSSSYEHYDSTPNILGTLKTSSGSAMKYKYVSLYYNGSKVATKKTGSTGKVRFYVSLPGEDMSGVWQLRYAGSSTYAKCASSTKKTHIHVHFQSLGQMPYGVDLDEDGVNDTFTIDVPLFMPGDSTYGIWTSVATTRYTFEIGGDGTDLYPGQAAVEFGELPILNDGYYLTALDCPPDTLVDVFVW